MRLAVGVDSLPYSRIRYNTSCGPVRWRFSTLTVRIVFGCLEEVYTLAFLDTLAQSNNHRALVRQTSPHIFAQFGDRTMVGCCRSNDKRRLELMNSEI